MTSHESVTVTFANSHDWHITASVSLAMSSAAPAQYLITLCAATQQPDLDEPFGVAVRIGSSDSKFKAAATKVIHSILEFSPAADTVAVEFLNELSKVTGMASLGKWSLCIPVGIF